MSDRSEMVHVGPIHKETRGKWFWSLSGIYVVILTRNRGILMHPFGSVVDKLEKLPSSCFSKPQNLNYMPNL
jgi:hypothetical protein